MKFSVPYFVTFFVIFVILVISEGKEKRQTCANDTKNACSFEIAIPGTAGSSPFFRIHNLYAWDIQCYDNNYLENAWYRSGKREFAKSLQKAT